MQYQQTQPAPREYHTQYYVVEVHRLVEVNPDILVRHVEKMLNMISNGSKLNIADQVNVYFAVSEHPWCKM